VLFLDASAVDTTASFSVAGEYVLRLTAFDGQLTAYDELKISVQSLPSPNQAPSVSAGLNQTVTFPEGAVLKGSISDDGLPDPPCLVTTTWRKVSGPGEVHFVDSSSVETRVDFSGEGLYVLRLIGDDSELTAYDDVIINVKSVNQLAYIYLPILVLK
jgi:hypothetical protein